MILCFDIGGSRIKAALAGGSALTALGEMPTPLADFAAFKAALQHLVQRAGTAKPRGVAISIAGVVDPETGRIKVANIPCLDGRPLAQELGRAVGLPVLVLNDADCFALAEARHGAGRGHHTVFGVILGSGVGGGLVIDGHLLTGAGGFAGEWGHGPVIQQPRFACPCGQQGCIDTIGGARGLERLHRHLGAAPLGSDAIVTGWQAGRAAEQATVALWLDLLSGPLAMVLNVVGASVVPVGGGLARAPALIAALDAAVRARLLRQSAGPVLVVAQVSVDAGLVGAAAAGEAAFGEAPLA